ncbi:MAG: hypothetical protein BD935_00080 [Marine Group III euryarchaeote CG-Epi1]|uniref:Aminotransferase DegT n=1 Tax=Marine Group III euryarchaeote CG-Epi1 TaxID=1888995 RepID=A0A1J5TJM3_9ARCH|nr:MAG: hypothetical protein BD935_00080 [Marine Group III euryarchaeote CG-Epi1]
MKVPFAWPYFTEKMLTKASLKALSEPVLQGKTVKEFEEKFAGRHEAKRGISLASGTDALTFSFLALGKKGDLVLCPGMSYVATSNAIISAGMVPVFVDINEKYLLDISKLPPNPQELGIKGMVCVHLYSTPCDLDKLKKYCDEHSLFLVEDCAQAHGAKIEGKSVGNMGDASIFSFYPTKNMTVCGDGGMVTTNREDIYQKILCLRHDGRLPGGNPYEHIDFGRPSRMSCFEASVGLQQLEMLDKFNERRHQISQLYLFGLSNLEYFTLPKWWGELVHGPHLFVVKVKQSSKISNTLLHQKLKDYDIGTSFHYPIPMHRQPIYQRFEWYLYDGSELFNSEITNFDEKEQKAMKNTLSLSLNCISLPIFFEMTNDQVDYVVNSIKEIMGD